MNTFSNAIFLTSAATVTQFPAEGPPEIAFLGRSNVGKSSALNALVARRRLAFTSKTPGRTQTANFYGLGTVGRLVDLPGYGYARVSLAERAAWEHLTSGYLRERRSLAGLVVLVDARRGLMPSDLQLLDWLRPLQVPQLLLLTKSDKLSAAERRAVLHRVRGGAHCEVMLFSSLRREGVEELRARLEGWLRNAAAEREKNPR